MAKIYKKGEKRMSRPKKESRQKQDKRSELAIAKLLLLTAVFRFLDRGIEFLSKLLLG